MPRFIARPVIVEAHQYSGHTHDLPHAFQLAVLRHVVGGTIEVATGDGARPCKCGDWIVRGPDGQFSVMRAATFEAMFEQHVMAGAMPPLVLPKLAPRSATRKETV